MFVLPLFYGLVYRRFVVTGDVAAGRPLPWWIWLFPALLLGVPIVLGRMAGRATWKRRSWAKFLTGPSPAPRAWDDLFATANLNGWIRLRTRDGAWVCGLWGRSEITGLDSYAAGYPEKQDLLLSDLAESDIDGDFVLGADDRPQLTGRSLLIDWDQVAYAEFIPG